MSTTIENLINKQKEIMATARGQCCDGIKEVFKEFFATYPDCVAVRWTQYTPYFNDGDECRFRVGDPSLRMVDTSEDAGDYEDGFEERYKNETKPFQAAIKAADKICNIDKEILKLSFGDHCRVTATKEGFEVEEYAHE